MQFDPPEVTISLQINGRAWQQVRSFDQSGPRDRHFVARVDADGRAVIQFGDGVHGARPPSGTRSVTVTYSPGSAFVGVSLQQGKGNFDDKAERFFSIYRGKVTSSLDPQNRLRVKVRVPEVLGSEEAWALPCLPVGTAEAPPTGKFVWVMFEAGDPNYPVWIGMFTEE